MALVRGPVRLTDEQRSLAEAVLNEHREGLWRLALLVAGSTQAAEDLLAAAIAQSLPYLDKLDRPAPIYLRTVMLKLRASEWQRRRGYTDSPYAQIPERAAAIDEAGSAALRTDISRALAGLAPRQRAVVVLRYLEDRSVAEVAQILGCSEVTVRSQAHRALEKLRGAGWLSAGSDSPARRIDEATKTTVGPADETTGGK